MIERKHNLSIKYSDCLLSEISVALSIAIGASRSGEKISGEALFTQHLPLYLFNPEKAFCCCLQSKTFRFFLNYKRIIVGRFAIKQLI